MIKITFYRVYPSYEVNSRELYISRENWNIFLDQLIQKNVQTSYGLEQYRNSKIREFKIHYNYFQHLLIYLHQDNYC